MSYYELRGLGASLPEDMVAQGNAAAQSLPQFVTVAPTGQAYGQTFANLPICGPGEALNYLTGTCGPPPPPGCVPPSVPLPGGGCGNPAGLVGGAAAGAGMGLVAWAAVAVGVLVVASVGWEAWLLHKRVKALDDGEDDFSPTLRSPSASAGPSYPPTERWGGYPSTVVRPSQRRAHTTMLSAGEFYK